MKISAGILFLICFNSLLQSQVTQEWVRVYNDSNTVWYIESAMVTDHEGNVYMTGYVGNQAPNVDFVTLKYNNSGVLLWREVYNGPNNNVDQAYSIDVDLNKNVYVTGTSYFSATGLDYITIKYNPDGIQEWVARYTGPTVQDFAKVVKADKSGNVYVTGYSNGGDSNYDYLTVKYDSNGSEQWVRRYNGTGNYYDRATAMSLDDSGNIIVTGYSTGAEFRYDFLTIKYNPAGVEQWVKRYHNINPNSDSKVNDSVVDRNGNSIITGQSYGLFDYLNYTTVKYNSAGEMEWIAYFNGPDSLDDIPYSVALDSSDNILVTGSSIFDYATVKYSPDGIQQWVAFYDGPFNSYDEAFDVAADKSGNIYVTGYSTGIPNAYYDYTTIKYSPAGVELWVKRFDSGGNNDIANSIGLDTSGNVFVSGSANPVGSTLKFLTLKYSQIVGIQQISSGIPEGYNLFQNFPNPFNPETHIKFEIPIPGITSITIYDILGKEVAVLLNERLSAGIYEIRFTADQLTAATYFYRIKSGDFIEVKKMLLIK